MLGSELDYFDQIVHYCAVGVCRDLQQVTQYDYSACFRFGFTGSERFVVALTRQTGGKGSDCHLTVEMRPSLTAK